MIDLVCTPCLLHTPRTLSGDQEHRLEIPKPDIQLREVQQQLCAHFHKSFPLNAASIVMDGKTYDEFCEQPFLALAPGSRAQDR